ncbi:MAG: hypothetical protein KDD56_01735 [Bdellovibrionales bacterium]|nr:hypothetical protein [Bdellovibrionales bacterium]
MIFRKKEKQHEGKVGGLAYFCSLIFLCFLGPVNIVLNIGIIDTNSILPWISFLITFFAGIAIAHYFIQGHWSVFFHEFKHSLISGFAGNKAKGWNIKEQSGHFEYAYTKSTAAYNAFISLAPYWVPLFSLPVTAISWIFLRDLHYLLTAVLGICYGMDFLMNIRDISPHQSDFTETRGGFNVSIIYVIAMNLTIFSYYAAFISQGISGFKLITFKLAEIMLHLIANYRGIPIDNISIL